MFNSLLTALVHEMLRFASKHADFFELKGEDARSKKLENVRIPRVFKAYLSSPELDGDAFMADLKLILRFVGGDKKVVLSDNAFFTYFVEFLTGPFASKLDMLDGAYYVMSDDHRDKVVEKLIKSDSHVAQSLRNLFNYRTAQELAEAIQNLCERVNNSPFIVVQSPREMSAEQKKEVRASLLKEDPLSFPHFQINQKLIGGLRVFKNGEVTDHSWLSRVLRFTSLTTV